MSEELVKYSAGSLIKGIDVFQGNMTPELVFDWETYNLTTGINLGVGPRYGMAALPGHNTTGIVGLLPGFMRAETTWDGAAHNDTLRTKIFGIVPLKLGGSKTSIGTRSTYYVALVGYTEASTIGAGTFFGAQLLSTGTGSPVTYFEHSPQLYAGLPCTIDNASSGIANIPPIQTELAGTPITSANGHIYLVTGKQYLSFSAATVTGPDVPAQWVFGSVVGGSQDATHPPDVGLWNIVTGASTVNALIGSLSVGMIPEIIYGNYKNTPRGVMIYGLTKKAERLIDWKATFGSPKNIYNPVGYLETSIQEPHLAFYDGAIAGTVTASKVAGGTGYTNVTVCLVNDSEMKINSSYKAILVATGASPIIVVLQDWARDIAGSMVQYVDPVNLRLEPPVQNTLDSVALAEYMEDGTPVKTCFASFPGFTSGTAMGVSTFGMHVNTPNTGILRAKTTYEFTYSIYNKRLNYETNVGVPAKFRTDTADFVGLCLYSTAVDGFGHTNANWVVDGTPYPPLMPFPNLTNNKDTFHINHLEYRFYYRQLGTFEWLPALFIDAAKYWFFPYFTSLVACSGAIGGLPGGQPGGFNDYSKLPADTYTCAVVFKNRAFWLSDKAGIFSMRNNFFAYPGRNSFALPTGSMKGAIVHAYPGEAEQSSRMVIFGTDGLYVGRFTGDLQEVPLQIGLNTVNFGLDGSDFHIDPWTSNTAFSHRSAVVARGVLYYWGPDGFYSDGGVELPQKISEGLEPDIFTVYDTTTTDDIHCVYNDKTKEIYWFYVPKVADGYATHAIIYDTRTGQFLRTKFVGKIDAADNVAIETAASTSGERVVLYSRATGATTIQRPYFFDHRNRSGDQRPTTDLAITKVTTPSTGRRRLTIGSDTSLASVAVGDYITLDQVLDYAPSIAACDDMIAKVVAVSNGTTPKTLDILLPSTASMDAAADFTSANKEQAFPVWHQAAATVGLNGIAWQLKSKYWMPGGANMSMYWMHLYLRFGVQLFKYIDQLTIGLQYRTPVSTALVTGNPIKIVDNSDGNCQVYRNMQPGDRGIEGQAMRYILSGNHIGHAWVLQWLEAHGNNQTFDFLKEFEG